MTTTDKLNWMLDEAGINAWVGHECIASQVSEDDDGMRYRLHKLDNAGDYSEIIETSCVKNILYFVGQEIRLARRRERMAGDVAKMYPHIQNWGRTG